MIKPVKTSLALAVLALTSTAAAHAAGDDCRGRVFVDTIYQVASTAGQFEYFIQARNGTDSNVMFNITLRNFNRDVQIFSPVLPNVQLQPYKNVRTRIGRGTSQNINSGTVSIVYDAQQPRANMPSITISHCMAR